jgi:hypothetical protein
MTVRCESEVVMCPEPFHVPEPSMCPELVEGHHDELDRLSPHSVVS